MSHNYPLIYNLSNNSDYTNLKNKPQINSVELSDNKTSSDLGLVDTDTVGALTDLTTTDQSSIVGAINEIDGKFPVAIADGGTGGTTATEARTNLGVMTGAQLYYNASGSTGTITLSDNVSNYNIIDICFFVPVLSSNWYGMSSIYTDGAESFNTSLTINISSFRNPSTTNDPRVNAFASNLSISGTSLTRMSTNRAYVTNNITPVVESTTDETTKIYKVVGYKF